MLILSDWAEFAGLDLQRIRTALAYPIVVDGRNLFDPATMASHGFQYYSVGRLDVAPAPSKAAAMGTDR